MENYAMTNFEEMVADEMFPETNETNGIFDSENFPTKDRKHASARRKKDYLVGKRRFTRFSDEWGLSWIVNNQPALQGIMRKTNIKNPFKDDYCNIQLKAKRVNVRRRDMANAAMVDYMED